jgi:hypothetical protein
MHLVLGMQGAPATSHAAPIGTNPSQTPRGQIPAMHPTFRSTTLPQAAPEGTSWRVTHVLVVAAHESPEYGSHPAPPGWHVAPDMFTPGWHIPETHVRPSAQGAAVLLHASPFAT